MAAGVAVNSRYMWITYKHIFAGKWLVSEFFVVSQLQAYLMRLPSLLLDHSDILNYTCKWLYFSIFYICDILASKTNDRELLID